MPPAYHPHPVHVWVSEGLCREMSLRVQAHLAPSSGKLFPQGIFVNALIWAQYLDKVRQTNQQNWAACSCFSCWYGTLRTYTLFFGSQRLVQICFWRDLFFILSLTVSSAAVQFSLSVPEEDSRWQRNKSFVHWWSAVQMDIFSCYTFLIFSSHVILNVLTSW